MTAPSQPGPGPAGPEGHKQGRAGPEGHKGHRRSAFGLIEWRRERARVGPWRSDDRTALLAPVPGAPPPSPGFIRRCLDQLAGDGFATVITGALAPEEQRPFLAAGFEEHEQLHLLGHDLIDLPRIPREPALRRGRRADRAPALVVDAAAFDAFWRLDHSGLQDALAATPSTRFRVADGRALLLASGAGRALLVASGAGRALLMASGAGRARPLYAYAVSGRSGRHGYLQRLAVDPAHQHRGLGRALALDALHWLRRHGVERAVVNTQLDNRAALELYRGLGFRLEPDGLAVLRYELGP